MTHFYKLPSTSRDCIVMIFTGYSYHISANYLDAKGSWFNISSCEEDETFDVQLTIHGYAGNKIKKGSL